MFAAQPKHQPEYTAEELRSTKLLLEHCLSYLKHHHDQNDGGLHINLIARIKEALERPEPEPVLVVGVWLDGNLPCFNTTWIDFPGSWIPGEYKLYTSPTSRKPLSDIDYELGFSESDSPDYTSFARGIKYAEKAHGIIQE